MIEAHKLPLKLTCVSCRGEGKQRTGQYYEAFPDVFETICDGCSGLGYTVEMQKSVNDLGVQY
jgi:DnaJ-class molecular chaperone